ncbi:MAG: hypothetical protein QG623_619 [Patescibacteria group bacterium]|nr:hypothetical protein [Patescibacteria group bacterium]
MTKIGMTPDQSVMWSFEGTDRGVLLLPEQPDPEVVNLLFGVNPGLSLELVGEGRRETGAAKVYRYGHYALRVTEGTDMPSHTGLGWLTANLSLSVALEFAQTPVGFTDVVRTPVYLGALSSTNGNIVVMSYEGKGRSHDAPKSLLDEVDQHCEAAFSSMFPGHSLYMDSAADNILVGPDDVVKLDVQPMMGFVL